MIGLAYPTFYYDLRGAAALAAVAAAGGVVSVGLSIVNPPLSDPREAALGLSLMVVFGARFVLFLADDFDAINDGWSWRVHWDLYRTSAALWVHSLLFVGGVVLTARHVRAKHGLSVEGVDDAED